MSGESNAVSLLPESKDNFKNIWTTSDNNGTVGVSKSYQIIAA